VSPIGKAHVGKNARDEPRHELKAQFDLLADRWSRETSYHSSNKHIVGHPAYQGIIRMGAVAVPFILERLSRGELDYWFYALSTLTGEYPIPYEARGNMILMTQAWLEWGIANGLVMSGPAASSDIDQSVAATATNSADRV
jgi:hypothetical protein